MLIDIIDNGVFMAIFLILLVILFSRPCYKALRFTNSLKIICLYVSVMTLAISQTLVDDILTLKNGETLRYPVVSTTTAIY